MAVKCNVASPERGPGYSNRGILALRPRKTALGWRPVIILVYPQGGVLSLGIAFCYATSARPHIFAEKSEFYSPTSTRLI